MVDVNHTESGHDVGGNIGDAVFKLDHADELNVLRASCLYAGDREWDLAPNRYGVVTSYGVSRRW